METTSDELIAAIAARQHSVFTLAETLEVGFSADEIAAMIRDGVTTPSPAKE